MRTRIPILFLLGSVLAASGAGPAAGSSGQTAELDRIDKLVRGGEYALAESLGAALFHRLREAGNGRTAEGARCQYLTGWAIFRGGNAKGADELLGRAIESYGALGGGADSALAPVLQVRGDVLIELNRPEEALTVYERRLRIVRALGGDDAPEVPGAHYSLGRAHYYGGDFSGALAEYSQALSLAERRWGKESLYAAYCRNVIGMVEDETGNFVEATESYREAARIVRAQKEPNRLFLANVLNNLAWSLRNLGDYDEARLDYEEALAIQTELIKPPSADIASTLGNLADLDRETGDLNEAEKYAKEALDMREQVYGKEHPRVATSLEFLGSLHLDMGRGAEARDEFAECLDIRRRAFGEGHPDVALALSELGSALRAVGDLAGARDALRRARPALEKGFTELHPSVTRAYLESARVEAEAGAYERAFAFASEAERRSREHLDLASEVLPDRLALRYAAERVSGRDLLVSLAERVRSGGMIRGAWDAVVRCRGLVLDEMAARERAARLEKSPEVRLSAGVLRQARERLAHLMVAGPDEDHPGEFPAKLRQARADVGDAEEALARESGSGRGRLTRPEFGLDAVLSSLPPGSGLVAYVRLAPEGEAARYAAFVARGRTVHLVPLGPADSIETAVGDWEAAVDAGSVGSGGGGKEIEKAYRKVALRLRRLIWDPLVSHLGECSPDFIVPDGVLHRVSFASLPVGDAEYVADDRTVIHYLSTERELASGGPPTGKSGNLLLVGDPDFDFLTGKPASRPEPDLPTPECGSLRGVRFRALGETEGEIRDVGALWSARGSVAPIVLTGPQATEADVRARIPEARVLHFATHGFFLDGKCAGPDLATRGIQGYSRRRTVPVSPVPVNPLQLSGLALAGANRREEEPPGNDGILTSEEITSLDLSRVDLVVLSACDTGLGRIESTEGVVGLRRSLQVAGAGTVVMSLWAVEDASTREWMTAFYRARLERGMGVPQSVQEAERACLAERRAAGRSTNPFYWAGFVSCGPLR